MRLVSPRKSPCIQSSSWTRAFFRGDLKGVANAYREALRVDPTDPNCPYELAFQLCLSGDHNGEALALREAVRQKSVAAEQKEAYLFDINSTQNLFDDDFSIDLTICDYYMDTYDQGYQALGSALAESGDLAGAIAACREAIRRDERGNVDDAILIAMAHRISHWHQ